MRKNLQSKVLLTLLAASVFYLPAYANAASLTINGDNITASDSVVDDWNIGTLISHKSSLQNNTITISNKEYKNLQQIFGAYAAQIGNTDGSHTNLQDNNVSIEANTFSYFTDIVGACAEFNNNNNTLVSFNSTASLQDNSVTISGRTFNGITTITGAVGTLYNVYFNGNQTKPTIEPTIEFTGNKVTIGSGTFNADTNVYGANTALWQHVNHEGPFYNMSAALKGNSVTINDGAEFNGQTSIYGACADLNDAPSNSSANCKASLTNNSVNINGGTFGDSTDTINPAINIRGAYINLHNVRDGVYDNGKIASTVTGNSVTISGGEFNAATNVYGAYANLTYPAFNNYFAGTAAITDNTVTLTGSAGAYDEDTQARDLKNVNLYGYGYNDSGTNAAINQDQINSIINSASNNNLIVDGWSGTVGSVNNFDAIDFENIKVSKSDDEKAESVFYIEASGDNNKGLADTTVNINSIAAGDYAAGTELSGTLTLDDAITANNIEISENLKNKENAYFASDNDDNGVVANKFSSISATQDENDKHLINLSASVDKTILAGKFIEADSEGNPIEHINSNGEAALTVNESLNNTHASVIAGAYAAGNNAATGGNIIVNGAVTKDLYAGYSENGDVKNNTLTLTGGADVTNVNLFGANTNESGAIEGNKLVVDDWKGTVNSLNNFAAIDFNNIAWENGSTVLTIADSTADLSGTAINLNSLKGGSTIKAGDTMTFVASADGHDLKITDVTVDKDKFLAGVALEGEGTYSTENGSLTFTINTVELTPQTDIVAETRAASAAFVNQGTDLINDSLDVLGRDGSYGVKTFAAVHGNRSTYDVADDLKINGWSTIVGVGNADKFDNGSEFSWGVFYENGSGNYRTYNSFNNEFFRGDGSMVYNGGGIAARYENKNGVYTEGSLRAGMLKNELDNAMRDVNGSYGYETESAYYGAHIGVGKIISLSDSSDLDIYGKFFHTYTEGDSVTIADDKFDFDSITSDRLRVGARITSNKENKFSTYYGLAYEYEFNGDADMTAQGLRADTQSLQGSSVMAEVGFNYQPGTDSPWNFDLNLRGYVGERQGGSFNVQATYTF